MLNKEDLRMSIVHLYSAELYEKQQARLYQTERSKDGQSFDFGKAQFDQTQHDDHYVEAVPAVL